MATRKPPARRAPASNRRGPAPARRPAGSSKRTPPKRVSFHSPVHIHRRRPQRGTVVKAGAGAVTLLSAITALVGAMANVTAMLIMVVVTILTALATLILAMLSRGDGDASGMVSALPAGDECGATTLLGGSCRRSVRFLPCPHHGSKGHAPAAAGGRRP